MAEILKPNVFRKMPVITKSAGTTNKEKSFSQKPLKIYGWNLGFLLGTCACIFNNFLIKIWDGRVKKLVEFGWFDMKWLVIISITRYRDIDRGFIERTISWRAYIVRYRARTHVSHVRCSHTAAAASASDWRRFSCTPSVAPSASRSLG